MLSPSLSAALSSGRYQQGDCYIGNEDGKSPVRSTGYTTSVVNGVSTPTSTGSGSVSFSLNEAANNLCASLGVRAVPNDLYTIAALACQAQNGIPCNNKGDRQRYFPPWKLVY